jgi:hypothetical protein
MINGEMKVKEKVSRPDVTGGWVPRKALELFSIKYHLYSEVCPFGPENHAHDPTGFQEIANQAIEKMIASAREKE